MLPDGNAAATQEDNAKTPVPKKTVIGAETRVERGECPANWIEDAPAWGALLAIFLTIASTAASNCTDIDKLMAASNGDGGCPSPPPLRLHLRSSRHDWAVHHRASAG